MPDNKKAELAIMAMQHALRAIASYGDCLHGDDHDAGFDGSGCTCPVCVARKALASQDAADWRFAGHMDYRRDAMPRERDIVWAWKAYLRRADGTPIDVVMSQIIGCEPTVRDWYVTTSVIQWLATNCGMSVLDQAGFKYDWTRKRE